MLYCNENRLVPTNINLMTIESEDGMYYYVHRSLYDQAVILNDRFKGKENELMELIGMNLTDQLPECIEFFHLVVPEPLNILGYFLALVQGFETLSADIEVLCGVIHQMSAALNFRSLISVPKEMRAQARFSLSIESEFRLSWDRFFQEAIPYEPDMFLHKASAYQPATGYVGDEDEPAEGEDEDGIFDWGAFADNIDKSLEESEDDTPAPVQVPTVTQPTVVDEGDGADDGYDLMKDLV